MRKDGETWRIRGSDRTHTIHGCLVYLPTFGCFFMLNVGKYTIDGASGSCDKLNDALTKKATKHVLFCHLPCFSMIRNVAVIISILYHMNHITYIYIHKYHITSYHYVQRKYGKPLNLIWRASFDQLERRQQTATPPSHFVSCFLSQSLMSHLPTRIHY